MSQPTLATITLTANAIMGTGNIPIIVGIDKYTYTYPDGNSITRDAHSLKLAQSDDELTKHLFKAGDKVVITPSPVYPTLGSVAGRQTTLCCKHFGKTARVFGIAPWGDVIVCVADDAGEITLQLSPQYLRKAQPFKVGDLVICDKVPETELGLSCLAVMHDRVGQVFLVQTETNVVLVSIEGVTYKFKPEWLRVVSPKEAELRTMLKSQIDAIGDDSVAEASIVRFVTSELAKRARKD